MPAKKKNPRSVDADTLRQLKAKGVESIVLDSRLAFMDIEGVARYVRGMVTAPRIYPSMLPTQADGRFSTSDPPLVNFPAWLRGGTKLGKDGKPYTPAPLIIPDDGTFWISHDWSALHARIAAGYSHDPVDLEAFRNDWDVHTITACGMWGIPLPPVKTKALHSAPECAEWRQLWTPAWEGDDDRRRRLAKIMRYATLLGKDEKSATTAKDIEKEGLTRVDVMKFGKMYLDSKHHLVACKRRVWEECARTGVSVTFMGRRRRLSGDWWSRAKEGWAHKLQGGEADMMTTYLAYVDRTYPDAYLVYNAHDGAAISFPSRYDPSAVKSDLSHVVEQEWNIEGAKVKTPADWKLWLPDATITKLK